MNRPFLLAATVLAAALAPLALVAVRRSLVSGLVAMELAGVLTTLVLLCYAVGTQSTSATGLALITAVLTWVSGLIYVRLMDRQP